MLGIDSLDILIGLVTIYLVMALACTAIVEALAAWINLRSNNLQIALKEFLQGAGSDDKFLKDFQAHPLIQSLSKGAKGQPSYIPAEVVGQVMQSIVTAADPAAPLRTTVTALPDSHLKTLLLTFINQGSEDTAAFRKAIATHFDAIMDRATGWVKYHQQNVSLAVAALLVILANVDTLALATALSASPEQRAKLVTLAEEEAKRNPPQSETPADAPLPTALPADTLSDPQDEVILEEEQSQDVEASANLEQTTPEPLTSTSADAPKIAKDKTNQALQELSQAKAAFETSGLPFGWQDFSEFKQPSTFFRKFVGLAVSILAVSLGAPFWFDVLQNVMRVRQTGINPREKKDDKNAIAASASAAPTGHN